LLSRPEADLLRHLLIPGRANLFLCKYADKIAVSFDKTVDYFDKRLEVAFNPYYFQDILRHSKDETVSFSLQDSYNPGAITDSTSALFVIMPMRLTEHQTEDIQNSDDSKKTVLT